MDLSKSADTDGLAEIDMAGDGGGADVEPIDRLGRKFFGRTRLDGVNPA